MTVQYSYFGLEPPSLLFEQEYDEQRQRLLFSSCLGWLILWFERREMYESNCFVFAFLWRWRRKCRHGKEKTSCNNDVESDDRTRGTGLMETTMRSLCVDVREFRANKMRTARTVSVLTTMMSSPPVRKTWAWTVKMHCECEPSDCEKGHGHSQSHFARSIDIVFCKWVEYSVVRYHHIR